MRDFTYGRTFPDKTIFNYGHSLESDADMVQFKDNLIKFSMFFSNPMAFDQNYTDRELRIIYSEFNYSKKSKDTFLQEMIRLQIKNECPYGKFGMGNKDTLKKGNTIDELTKLHSTGYIPENMQLVINSKLSLDDMKKITLESFANLLEPKYNNIKIPNKVNNSFEYNKSI